MNHYNLIIKWFVQHTQQFWPFLLHRQKTRQNTFASWRHAAFLPLMQDFRKDLALMSVGNVQEPLLWVYNQQISGAAKGKRRDMRTCKQKVMQPAMCFSAEPRTATSDLRIICRRNRMPRSRQGTDTEMSRCGGDLQPRWRLLEGWTPDAFSPPLLTNELQQRRLRGREAVPLWGISRSRYGNERGVVGTIETRSTVHRLDPMALTCPGTTELLQPFGLLVPNVNMNCVLFALCCLFFFFLNKTHAKN